MNFQKIKESDEVELPLLLKNRLIGLVSYIKQKVSLGEFDALSLAEIAKDNRMTIPQLMEFGFTKANLVCHAVVSINEALIQHSIHLNFEALGDTLSERVQAYLLHLYEHELPQQPFRVLVQQYVWNWSVVDEDRVTNQAMKLMSPIYLAMHQQGFDQLDARCQAIWALYQRGLRVSAIGKRQASDCLASIRQALLLMTERNV